MRMKNLLYVGVVSVAILAMTACSKPPEELIKATGDAMSAAKSAQADLYAGDALARAQDLMNQADALKKVQDDKFALFRSYKDVEAKFNEAKAAFAAAQTAAVEGKAQKKAEAETKVQEATAALDAAEAALKMAPKSKDTKADLEAFANDIATYRQTLADAQAGLASEDYLGTINKADSVNQKAAEIAAQVQAAIDKVKGKK